MSCHANPILQLGLQSFDLRRVFTDSSRNFVLQIQGAIDAGRGGSTKSGKTAIHFVEDKAIPRIEEARTPRADYRPAFLG